MFNILIYIVLIFILNLFIKKKYLQSYNGSNHQRLTNILPLTEEFFNITRYINF